jgi:thioredoxin reductase (NADPH)
VDRFEPGENGSLSKAVLRNVEDDSQKEVPITGAFIAIGHRPNSQLVEDQLDVDPNGYVQVEGRTAKTKLPGVFAAGDLTDHVYRQAVTAAGTGCIAALDAEAYLRDTPVDPEAHWAGRAERLTRSDKPERVTPSAQGQRVRAAAESAAS